MKVRMLVAVSGLRDGDRWPARGEVVDLPDGEAADLVAAGIAEPISVPEPVGERAVAEPAGEKRVRRAKA